MIKDISMRRIFALLLCALLLAFCACGQAESVREAATTFELTTLLTTLSREQEPISYTYTQRIHPDMPEFTFVLHGVYDGNINITDIDIRDESGSYHQTFDGLEISRMHYAGGGLEFVDYNNDGYLDIHIESTHNYFWLWDNTQGKFVENIQLRELREGGLVTVWYLDNGRLSRYISLDPGHGSLVEIYEYVDGVFVLVDSWEEWV